MDLPVIHICEPTIRLLFPELKMLKKFILERRHLNIWKYLIRLLFADHTVFWHTAILGLLCCRELVFTMWCANGAIVSMCPQAVIPTTWSCSIVGIAYVSGAVPGSCKLHGNRIVSSQCDQTYIAFLFSCPASFIWMWADPTLRTSSCRTVRGSGACVKQP